MTTPTDPDVLVPEDPEKMQVDADESLAVVDPTPDENPPPEPIGSNN